MPPSIFELGRGIPPRRIGVLGELLADVPRTQAAILTPVRVPVRPMRAPGAVLPATPNVLLPVGHLARPLDLDPRIPALPGDQEPPDEDQEPAQIELVQFADLPHEVAIDGHLRRECTQEPKSSKPDQNQTERALGHGSASRDAQSHRFGLNACRMSYPRCLHYLRRGT